MFFNDLLIYVLFALYSAYFSLFFLQIHDDRDVDSPLPVSQTKPVAKLKLCTEKVNWKFYVQHNFF